MTWSWRHCSRCWMTLYMYEEDLLWVWMVWGVSIMRINRDPPPTQRRSTLRSQRADTDIRSCLWPLATVAGAQSLYMICMKKTCYEYEMDVGSQSYVTVEPHGKTKRISYLAGFSSPIEQITVWSCILMTCSHYSRYWIALYVYKEDLLRVMSLKLVRVSTIIYSMRNQVKPLQASLLYHSLD